MWKDVYADFTNLPKHEQQVLFNLIKEGLFSDEEEMKYALMPLLGIISTLLVCYAQIPLPTIKSSLSLRS